MEKARSDSNNSGKDIDPRQFLREVLERHRSIEELLLHPMVIHAKPWCLRLTKNQADAEDLHEDAKLKVFMNFHTHFELIESSEYGGFPTWLNKIIFNLFVDGRRRQRLSLVDERPEEIPAQADCRQDVERTALYHELQSIIEHLPPKLRAVAELYVLKGLSPAETVRALAERNIKISPPTVKSLVRRALLPFYPKAASFSVSEITRKEHRLARHAKAKAAEAKSRQSRKPETPATFLRSSTVTESRTADGKVVKRKKTAKARLRKPKPTRTSGEIEANPVDKKTGKR